MDRPPTKPSNSGEKPDANSPTELDANSILNLVGDGTIQLTSDGYIVSVSEALAARVERDWDDLVGKHVSKFLDPETIAHAQADIQKRLLDGSEDTVTLSFPVYTASDGVVPCKARLSPVFEDGEFTGTVGVVRGVTDRAVDHGRSDVTIRVGSLSGTEGFYVEDDGPGIPPDEREAVFEAGYSESKDGMGLGLTFIAHLADAYSWSYRLTSSDDGGARFEFTDVDCTLEL